ncbi:hypothetical protein B0T22DRAFT_449635 [Podospora appendiculata]|uniref:Uncharacterized protein n=1 Tax=Podospora appendiculata TaxID=314037 RepID=A0AAE1CGJ3_9PEZI|nr:hypothetical protein B0T22DRAFT_449635 [Podospora appendiculata]
MISFIQNQPRLVTSLLSLGAIGAAAAYLAKRELDRTCPRVPISALPKASAARNFVQRPGEPSPKPSWGLESSTLLSSWNGRSDDDDDGNKTERESTHWIPSFVALQADVPLSFLAQYKTSESKGAPIQGRDEDALSLTKNFLAAFLDARAAGPEAWFLDKDVPPLSFAPGSHLFGDSAGLGAFLLGTWRSSPEQSTHFQPPDLPSNVPHPVSEFPSNEAVISHSAGEAAAAGAIMYWKVPEETVRMADTLAAWGLPWRLMLGGFQEFMAEKVSDTVARVTYVSVESAHLYPGRTPKRDFKTLPWVGYQLHVFYAQVLLYKAVMRLQTGQ